MIRVSRFLRSLGLVQVVVAMSAGACRDDKPELKHESERPRRVIEPPSRAVRALPPHAIRADGIGPYKLGALASDLLEQLPSGPRITQFTIPGIVHRDMMRGEDDAILIGTEPQGRAMFVAVVRSEIARTESGIQVGSTRDALEQALGEPLEDPERARDPRIEIPSKLDNAHVVVDGNRVSAIVLTPPVDHNKDAVPEEPAKDKPCTRPAGDREHQVFGACLTPAGEQVRWKDEQLEVLGKEGEKPIPALHVPGLVFAAALRNPVDSRDDLVAITETGDEQSRTWSLTAYRLIDGKLMRVIEQTPLYQLTSLYARWVGAELRDLDLMLELTAKTDTIEAGGLLATRAGASIRDIVVILPAVARRRGAKAAAPTATDTGAGSASSGSGSAQAGSGSGSATNHEPRGSAHPDRPTH